jgi:hypothetical protein
MVAANDGDTALTINRTTFLNTLLTLHEVGGVKEISEDTLNFTVGLMKLSSDDAVTMINTAQKDGLVHLRWRGWVTLTERGRAAAEGRGTATFAGGATFADTGAAGTTVRLDALAGMLFGAAQFVHGADDAATGATAALAGAVTESDPHRDEVGGRLDALREALANLPDGERDGPAASTIRKAAGSIANWAGVAWR